MLKRAEFKLVDLANQRAEHFLHKADQIIARAAEPTPTEEGPVAGVMLEQSIRELVGATRRLGKQEVFEQICEQCLTRTDAVIHSIEYPKGGCSNPNDHEALQWLSGLALLTDRHDLMPGIIKTYDFPIEVGGAYSNFFERTLSRNVKDYAAKAVMCVYAEDWNSLQRLEYALLVAISSGRFGPETELDARSWTQIIRVLIENADMRISNSHIILRDRFITRTNFIPAKEWSIVGSEVWPLIWACDIFGSALLKILVSRGHIPDLTRSDRAAGYYGFW